MFNPAYFAILNYLKRIQANHT